MQSRSTSPNDSSVSESLVNIHSTFRVSVCLQRYFKDVRSQCYILVNRNRPVRWLERRIQKIFALSGKFCLSTNGHMLPSCEPLALLNTDDTVNVVPLTDLGADLIKGNTADHGMYKYNEERSRSVLQADSNQCNIIESLKINHSKSSDNVPSENNLKAIQIINEDQIDGTSATEQSSNCIMVVDSQETSDASTSHMNTCDDTNQSLSNMKRKALAMLDCTLNVDKDYKKVEEGFPDPPSRTRHRVRRRRRRRAEPVQDAGDPQEETHLSETIPVEAESRVSSVPKLLETSQTLQIRATMQRASSPMYEIEPNIISSSPLPEVTRNQTMYPRKARVVHSLDE